MDDLNPDAGDAIHYKLGSDGATCDVSCPRCGLSNRIVISWGELCAALAGRAVSGASYDVNGITYDGIRCRQCPASALPIQVEWREVQDWVRRAQRAGFVQTAPAQAR